MNVVYISIDALRADYLRDAERLGLALPNLRALAESGSWARAGAKSVFPSFTYPCHATMISGVDPATHGVVNNTYFDPPGVLNGAWYWYAGERGVPTLWDAASAAGYRTANVGWSGSVGARMDYDLPQVWLTSTPIDVQFINGMSRPQGLARELERAIGRLTTYRWDIPGDEDRTEAAIWLLEHKLVPGLSAHPFFMTVYYAAYDDIAHNHGALSPEAREAIEAIDGMVGRLVEQVKSATAGDVVFCIVSDHGMLDNTCSLRPNVLFVNEGLIQCDAAGQMTSWEVYMQRAGGTAEIRLRDPHNDAVRAQVAEILERLAADPDSGIEKLLDRKACRARGGMPDADFALVGKRGCELREDLQGDYRTDKLNNQAQHGYSEEFEEMRTIFMLTGSGIPAGQDPGVVELADFAPTLARIMDIALPMAQGKVVD